MQITKDFFVSYTKSNVKWAEWIAWVLEDNGYSVVIQAWDFRPGNNFVLEMQNAAAQCEKTLAVLSQDYINANFTQPEWAAAFSNDATGSDRKLIPVLVERFKLEGLLKQIIYIDLVNKTPDEAKNNLLSGISMGRAKPSSEPQFPGSAPNPVPYPGNGANP